VSAVAFDNTILSILLNPNGKIPLIKGTVIPVDLAKERAESVVMMIQKSKRKIKFPRLRAPNCSQR